MSRLFLFEYILRRRILYQKVYVYIFRCMGRGIFEIRPFDSGR